MTFGLLGERRRGAGVATCGDPEGEHDGDEGKTA